MCYNDFPRTSTGSGRAKCSPNDERRRFTSSKHYVWMVTQVGCWKGKTCLYRIRSRRRVVGNPMDQALDQAGSSTPAMMRGEGSHQVSTMLEWLPGLVAGGGRHASTGSISRTRCGRQPPGPSTGSDSAKQSCRDHCSQVP